MDFIGPLIKLLLLGGFGVLAAGLLTDTISLEEIGIGSLFVAVLVVSVSKILQIRSKKTDVSDLKIPGKKKMMLSIIAMVLGIILAAEFFVMFLNSQMKNKLNIKQADTPTGKPAATATMLIVGVLLVALILFYYNLDYYLKTPDSMWVIVSSFLFAILMVMVLGIFILKDWTLMKYNITDG